MNVTTTIIIADNESIMNPISNRVPPTVIQV